MPNHDYTTRILWTGNRGEGTAHYKAYDRTWDIAVLGKAVVHCSNDSLLGGDPAKMNPEDLLLGALSACHMLWYLHYASDAGIVVTSYSDSPLGVGEVGRGGAGAERLHADEMAVVADPAVPAVTDACFHGHFRQFPAQRVGLVLGRLLCKQ